MFEVGTELTPKVDEFGDMRTGFAVVIGIEPIPEKLKNMVNEEYLYVVMTNFGNTFRLTENEINTAYKKSDHHSEWSLSERIERQMELLGNALDYIKKGQ